jgi:transcriptional regulator with XRE-family HTH domain
MDHASLGRELVRALRGKRSQSALSRRLGYKTNALYTWESGRSDPAAFQLFRLATKVGIDPRAALERFYRAPPTWLRAARVVGATEVAAMLEHERGGLSVSEVARESGVSRFSLTRYLRAEADIRLPDFLRVLDFCSRRLLDFVALWVDPTELPTAREPWRRQELARRAAYERPWSHAVLRALELTHDDRGEPQAIRIGRQLGIEVGEVEACLKLLHQGGQIRKVRGRFTPDHAQAVDLSSDREAARRLAAWWVEVAAQRARRQQGMFAYNLCSVSEGDLQRIAELERDYLRQVRAIVANSTPAERVALIAVQVFGFDGKAWT